MNNISLNLEECFGIKKLEHTFDFGSADNKRFIGIYSSNGLMKSSLAKTFRDFPTLKENIYNKEPKIDIKIDNQNFNPECCLVVKTSDDILSDSDKGFGESSSLLLNTRLKKKYDALNKIKFKKMNKLFNEESGFKDMQEFLSFVKDIFDMELKEVIEKFIIKGKKDLDFESLRNIKFKDFFNNSLDAISKNPDFEEKYKTYLNKVEKISFFDDTFTTISLSNIATPLKTNKFFNGRNKIIISDPKGVKKEFINQGDIEEFLNSELGEEQRKILDIVKRNPSTRGIAGYLKNNPKFIARLNDIEKFKKDVMLSYLFNKKKECLAYLKQEEKTNAKNKEIIQQAKDDETEWERIVKLFNSRFDLPFKIEINNKPKMVLSLDQGIKNFSFSFSRTPGGETVIKDKVVDLDFLSEGERKSLHILRFLFDVEHCRREGIEKLIILDDVIDSFDYKNRHAFLEYLIELRNEKNFYFFIFTHNFDFLRNLVTKGILEEKNAYTATGRGGVIELTKFDDGFIYAPFKKLCDPKKVVKNNEYLIAAIPFLRALIDIQGNIDNGDELKNKLDKMLHIQKGSPELKIRDFKDIYSKIILKTKLKENRQQDDIIVTDFIKSTYENVETISETDLYKKIGISITIRLYFEEILMKKSNKEISDIQNAQKNLWWKAKKGYIKLSDEEREVFNKVKIATNDYLHVNYFMYEPLVDQSSKNLIELLNRVKKIHSNLIS